jgi:hypothetical protein
MLTVSSSSIYCSTLRLMLHNVNRVQNYATHYKYFSAYFDSNSRPRKLFIVQKLNLKTILYKRKKCVRKGEKRLGVGREAGRDFCPYWRGGDRGEGSVSLLVRVNIKSEMGGSVQCTLYTSTSSRACRS